MGTKQVDKGLILQWQLWNMDKTQRGNERTKKRDYAKLTKNC